MKRSESAELVMTLLAAYPAAKTTASTSQVYETMLSDLDVKEARGAVMKLIATSRFLPTIAEIRSAAAEQTLGPVRSGADAWLDVVSEIRRIGQYSAPVFTDALVESLVRRWGWNTLCVTGTDADRARFIEAYDALARQARTIEVTGRALSPAPEPARLKKGAA